jgi:hypothetical protein
VTPRTERRVFQVVLGLLLVVPLGVGPFGAVLGLRGFELVFGVRLGPIESNLDSDFRFLAAAFAGLGVVLLSTLPHIERDSKILRISVFALFCGGLARLLSWATVGPPNGITQILTAVELALPLLALWQRRIARRSG